MRDAGLVELRADRPEPGLQIKTLGMKLRMQHGAAAAERARLGDHEIEQAAADAAPAPFAQHRHPPDLRILAMHDPPRASERPPPEHRERVMRVAVVVVELD